MPDSPQRATPKLPLLQPIALGIRKLPDALHGLRILHLSDVHINRDRKRHALILRVLTEAAYDLLCITGDLMTKPGDEPAAEKFTWAMLRAAKPRIGTFACWGNHDTPDLRKRLTNLPWTLLNNAAWISPELPLTILGVNAIKGEHRKPAGDLVAAFADEQRKRVDRSPHCRILLSHMPIWLPAAGTTDIHLMLSGHTHAGQIRMPTGRILYNATRGWPNHLSSGWLRFGTCQAVISRGLGEVYMNGLRLFSRPHIPLYTLTRKDLPIVHTIERPQNW